MTTQSSGSKPPRLLSDPFLQLPGHDSVYVAWFTDFPGVRHLVYYGQELADEVEATTSRLSRTREDQDSWLGEQHGDAVIYRHPTRRDVWRHEARIEHLAPNRRVPYRVASIQEDGMVVSSRVFTLSPAPGRGTPAKILLTSDHQNFPMTAANLQKVVEEVGRVDAVFMAGDLVNVPDRASEWFDDNRGCAFFPMLQGRAHALLNDTSPQTAYKGGEIIQYAPLFPVVGNHDVMGRFSMINSLNIQSDDSQPREVARQSYLLYEALFNPDGASAIREHWIEDNSFNARTFQEIFTLPGKPSGKMPFYAISFGDVRLVALCVARTWRIPGYATHPTTRGAYHETDIHRPAHWGYGAHLFEPIVPDSAQYRWLINEFHSDEFQSALFRVVMMHHAHHSLGADAVPPFTEPVQVYERSTDGSLRGIRYKYPRRQDAIIYELEPLFEQAGVSLVLMGHNHLWNRFTSPAGIDFLETSNVGNTHNAYVGEHRRWVPDEYVSGYADTGDPCGLEPVVPNRHPLTGPDGKPLPYVASNHLTVFSILNTGTGTVSSYCFDVREPEVPVVKFDEFRI